MSIEKKIVDLAGLSTALIDPENNDISRMTQDIKLKELNKKYLA